MNESGEGGGTTLFDSLLCVTTLSAIAIGIVVLVSLLCCFSVECFGDMSHHRAYWRTLADTQGEKESDRENETA